jgi:hypothetical protein
MKRDLDIVKFVRE